MGQLKLNCDACWCSNKPSYGVIIRDYDDKVIACRYGNLTLDSAFAAECYAVFMGLQLLSNRGWLNDIIESDCCQLILLLQYFDDASP